MAEITPNGFYQSNDVDWDAFFNGLVSSGAPASTGRPAYIPDRLPQGSPALPLNDSAYGWDNPLVAATLRTQQTPQQPQVPLPRARPANAPTAMDMAAIRAFEAAPVRQQPQAQPARAQPAPVRMAQPMQAPMPMPRSARPQQPGLLEVLFGGQGGGLVGLLTGGAQRQASTPQGGLAAALGQSRITGPGGGGAFSSSDARAGSPAREMFSANALLPSTMNNSRWMTGY